MVVHPEGELVDVGGHRLWVEREGSGDPVLLLAGLGPAGSHVVFHPHFTPLAADHTVIYVDLHGRGRSDHPADLRDVTFDGDVADVAMLVERLGLGPCHVYGFSYGGLVGQALALRHPAAVRTLTLANSLHSAEMWQLNHENLNREIRNQLPETWDRIQELRRAGVPSTDAEMQAEFAAAAALCRFHDPAKAALLATEPGARNVELYPVFVGDDVDFVVGGEVARLPDFRRLLPRVTVPVQVIAGRYDRALYPALQRQFVDHAPAVKLHVLERSGSFSHVEEPEEVFRLLRTFWS